MNEDFNNTRDKFLAGIIAILILGIPVITVVSFYEGWISCIKWILVVLSVIDFFGITELLSE